MALSWPDFVSSVVHGKYVLNQFLGEEDDSGVFLASAPGGTLVDVYLMVDKGAGTGPVRLPGDMLHPHLLEDIAAGETLVESTLYRFRVTEHVEERLADVIAGRNLAENEAHAVVEAVLSGLDYLHKHGYTLRQLTPENIVAAGDRVKLSTRTVRPLPGGTVDSRQAIAADLQEFARTTAQMLTGKREVGPGVELPPPFREFVQASFGTDKCPYPTASQLLELLHGKPLPTVEDVARQNPPRVHSSVPIEQLAAGTVEGRPTRIRPRMVALILGGVLLLAVAFAASRSIAGRNREDTQRTRMAVVPPADVKPSMAVPSQPASAVPSSPAVRKRWAVIAAAYSDYDGAARRAVRLRDRWKHGTPSVFPEKGKGSRYLVVLGSAASQKEAERLRAKARASGMPGDTYVTRLQF